MRVQECLASDLKQLSLYGEYYMVSATISTGRTVDMVSATISTGRTVVSSSLHPGPSAELLKYQVLQVCQTECRRGCSQAPPPPARNALASCCHLPRK